MAAPLDRTNVRWRRKQGEGIGSTLEGIRKGVGPRNAKGSDPFSDGLLLRYCPLQGTPYQLTDRRGLGKKDLRGSPGEANKTGPDNVSERVVETGSRSLCRLFHRPMPRAIDIDGGAGIDPTPTATAEVGGRTVTRSVCCTDTPSASVAHTTMVAEPYWFLW